MVLLLLDSSFLMLITNSPTYGFEDVKNSIGKVELVVLKDVVNELLSISNLASTKRRREAERALQYASKLKCVTFSEGVDVDDKILNYAKVGGVIVATLDNNLRNRLRSFGITVIFQRGNRFVTEGVT